MGNTFGPNGFSSPRSTLRLLPLGSHTNHLPLLLITQNQRQRPAGRQARHNLAFAACPEARRVRPRNNGRSPYRSFTLSKVEGRCLFRELSLRSGSATCAGTPLLPTRI